MVYIGWMTGVVDVVNVYGHQLNEVVVTGVQASGGGGAMGASSWRSIWRMVDAFADPGVPPCSSPLNA